MSLACEVAPTVLEGSKAALFICGIECHTEKFDLKRNAKKTDITGSTSYYNGYLWDEFTGGSRGGGLSWSSKWKANQQITPPQIREGAIYPVAVYVRRPQANGASDPGSAFTMNLFIDSNDLSFDMSQGIINWSCSGTATGPIIPPS